LFLSIRATAISSVSFPRIVIGDGRDVVDDRAHALRARRLRTIVERVRTIPPSGSSPT
jgi:hypothetical protein